MNFNVGPAKTAAMAVGDSPRQEDAFRPALFGSEVPFVYTYCYLGVLLDAFFTMLPHLTLMLSRGRAALDSFHGCALSLNLPIPLLSAAIPSRIESVALYGVELCVGCANAESSLNNLQAAWARSLLGCKESCAGAQILLVAE